MKKYLVAIALSLAFAPAVAAAATPPGTCGIVYGPKAIPGDSAHNAVMIHMDIAPSRVANWHAHPGAEYVSIVSGSGWLETEGRPRVDVHPGGAYAIAPNVVHRLHNTSASNHLVWTGFVVLPAGEHTHTVLKKGSGPWTPGCSAHI